MYKSRIKALIDHIRCATASGGNYPPAEKCFNCHFCDREDVTGTEYGNVADWEHNGKKYVLSCNGDRLMLEAAIVLTELLEEAENET